MIPSRRKAEIPTKPRPQELGKQQAEGKHPHTTFSPVFAAHQSPQLVASPPWLTPEPRTSKDTHPSQVPWEILVTRSGWPRRLNLIRGFATALQLLGSVKAVLTFPFPSAPTSGMGVQILRVCTQEHPEGATSHVIRQKGIVSNRENHSHSSRTFLWLLVSIPLKICSELCCLHSTLFRLRKQYPPLIFDSCFFFFFFFFPFLPSHYSRLHLC